MKKNEGNMKKCTYGKYEEIYGKQEGLSLYMGRGTWKNFRARLLIYGTGEEKGGA